MEKRNDGSNGHKAGHGYKAPICSISQTSIPRDDTNGGTKPYNSTELLQSGYGNTEKCNDIRPTCTSSDGPELNVPLTNIALINIQGLKPRTIPSKVPFLQDLLSLNKLLFIALTETWLREHMDAEVNVQGYKLFRQDRVRTSKFYK